MYTVQWTFISKWKTNLSLLWALQIYILHSYKESQFC